MCDTDDCTHGDCIYIPPGHTFATWPANDIALTHAIQEALADRGITRGTD